jgi:hypothetical protein
MNNIKTTLAYLHNSPIITGLFTVLFTVALGMSLAFATGLTTPAKVFADVLPPCCVIPPPPPPPVLPPCCTVPTPPPPPAPITPVVPEVPTPPVTPEVAPPPAVVVPVPPVVIPPLPVVVPPVVPPVPVCTLKASPTTFATSGGSSTLSWTSVAATSATIDNGVGSVTPVDSGSRTVSVTATKTYILTVSGPGGESTCEAGVTVTTPATPPGAPVCTLTAAPTGIVSGASSVLSWTTTNATTFSINQSIGAVTPVASGSKSVSPVTTTTYTGTATGGGSTATCTATIAVTPFVPPGPDAPVCTLTAVPASIAVGSASTLSWTTTNATTFSINNGIGNVTPIAAGSKTTPPLNINTTFTGTVANAIATTTCAATVTVNAPPSGSGGGGTPPSGGGGGGAGSISPVIPNVTLAVLPHVTPQPLAFLYLSQIPYTGLDLGPLGTAFYWLALIVFALAAAYLVLFGVAPLAKRALRSFGSSVSTALNEQKTPSTYAQIEPLAPPPALAPENRTMENTMAPEASHARSSYDGFKSFANNSGALSIEDIVKSLSRSTEPIYDKVEPFYEHVDPITEMTTMPASGGQDAAPASVRGFTSALLEGDRVAVFAGLRQHVRGAGAPEQLISTTVCLLDDAYRARIDGSPCDADIARLTARLSTPTLENLIASLTTAIDSSYSTGVTGAKLALTRALTILGA